MEITKVEFQELGLDPTKKYIVNLYFAEDTPMEVRGHMTRQFKMMLEDNGFTNLIFNPCPEMCKAEFQGVKEK